MKSVQISEDLFKDIINCIIFPSHYTKDEYLTLKESVINRILEKVDAINRRDAYTRYKTAATPEERESALREYILRKEET